MTDFTPYAPPTSAPMQATHLPETTQTERLRKIVFSWEKLRLIYNAVLALPGVGILVLSSRSSYFELSSAIASALFFGIFANICFLLGPLAELYISALWKMDNSDTLRKVLFWLGLGFSLLIVLLCLIAVV